MEAKTAAVGVAVVAAVVVAVAVVGGQRENNICENHPLGYMFDFPERLVLSVACTRYRHIDVISQHEYSGNSLFG